MKKLLFALALLSLVPCHAAQVWSWNNTNMFKSPGFNPTLAATNSFTPSDSGTLGVGSGSVWTYDPNYAGLEDADHVFVTNFLGAMTRTISRGTNLWALTGGTLAPSVAQTTLRATNIQSHDNLTAMGGFTFNLGTNIVMPPGSNTVPVANAISRYSYVWLTSDANTTDPTLRTAYLGVPTVRGGWLVVENYTNGIIAQSAFQMTNQAPLVGALLPWQTLTLINGDWKPTRGGESLLLQTDGRGWREVARWWGADGVGSSSLWFITNNLLQPIKAPSDGFGLNPVQGGSQSEWHIYGGTNNFIMDMWGQDHTLAMSDFQIRTMPHAIDLSMASGTNALISLVKWYPWNEGLVISPAYYWDWYSTTVDPNFSLWDIADHGTNVLALQRANGGNGPFLRLSDSANYAARVGPRGLFATLEASGISTSVQLLDSSSRAVKWIGGRWLPDTDGRSVGGAGFGNLWDFWGTNVWVEGFSNGGLGSSKMQVYQPGTNAPVIFDQQTSGTAGYSRGFEFRTNGVTLFSITGTGGPSSAANWTTAGTANPATDSALPANGTATATFLSGSLLPFKPSSFAWFTQTVSRSTTTGTFVSRTNATGDFDVATLKPTGGVTYYVGFPGAADINNGLSVGASLATFTAALTRTNVGTIIVSNTVITRANCTWSPAPTNSIVVICTNGTATLSGHDNLTWSLATGGAANTYVATRSAVAWVFDSGVLDANGNYFRCVTNGTYPGTGELAAGEWNTDNVNVWVRTSDSRNLIGDTAIRPYLTTAIGGYESNIVYCENIKFEGTQPMRARSGSSLRPTTFLAKNCEFNYNPAIGGNGFYSLGATGILQNCSSKCNRGDGFGYHANAGCIPYGIEINCTGRDNGWSIDAADIENGSSCHDAGSIVRLNGKYYRNKGPNVVDVTAGTTSWNIGCIAWASTAATPPQNANYYSEGTVWLDSCAGTTDQAVATDYQFVIGPTAAALYFHAFSGNMPFYLSDSTSILQAY